MESIEVVSSVRRVPRENLPRSLELVSSETSPIFEKCDSDFQNPSQAIPKATSESSSKLSSPVVRQYCKFAY